MRLFVAIQPPEEVVAALARLRQRLARRLGEGRAGPRWVRPERMHLTLAFLGEVEPALVPELGRRLEAAAARFAPFRLVLDRLGGFPPERPARVLFAEPAEPGPVPDLARAVRLAAAEAGCPPKEARFHPHLTLARAGRRRLEVPDLEPELPGFEVEEISLVHSILHGPDRGYETLAAAPLLGADPGPRARP